MKALCYQILGYIAVVHEQLLRLNDACETYFTDKQLHFLVFGACGLVLFWIVHAVFKRLAKWSLTAVSWIYTMTVMVGVTLAIEVGQKVTGTGSMELGDMLYGLWGFLLFFAVFVGVREVLRLLFGRGKKNKNR